MRNLSVYKKAKSYPTRPILTDEERMTPMLLCRVPSIPKQYSRERLNQLATPKVKTKNSIAFCSLKSTKSSNSYSHEEGLSLRRWIGQSPSDGWQSNDILERPLGRTISSFEKCQMGKSRTFTKNKIFWFTSQRSIDKACATKGTPILVSKLPNDWSFQKNFTRPELEPVPQYRFSCGRGSEIEATIRLQKRNRRARSPSARLIELSKSVHRPHIEKVDPVRRISEVRYK